MRQRRSDRWSAEDEELIASMKHTDDELAALTGRTLRAVRQKRAYMKIIQANYKRGWRNGGRKVRTPEQFTAGVTSWEQRTAMLSQRLIEARDCRARLLEAPGYIVNGASEKLLAMIHDLKAAIEKPF